MFTTERTELPSLFPCETKQHVFLGGLFVFKIGILLSSRDTKEQNV